MLDYAIVVATRNRLPALQASVPLFLGQSRPAARLVVVDRSDDHEAVAGWLAEIARDTPIPIEVIHADQANSSHQRNLGLARVQEAVTLMPDDDSLWFPDTAAKFMEVYDRDTEGLIGGVAGINSASPLTESNAPERDHALHRNPTVQYWRNKVEKHFAPQPFDIYAQLQIADLLPSAHEQGLADLKPVESIAGYRMSFRTETVRVRTH